jgi:hypothetical protein
MAESSGVSAEDLKAKITEVLQASHVDIEDMSGKQIISFILLPLPHHIPRHADRFLDSQVVAAKLSLL